MFICEQLELPRKPAVTYTVMAEGSVIFRQIGPAILTDDMAEYLSDRAQQLGVSIWDAYCEEMKAKRELQQITPNNAALLEIAKNGGPPPGLADDPEERFW